MSTYQVARLRLPGSLSGSICLLSILSTSAGAWAQQAAAPDSARRMAAQLPAVRVQGVAPGRFAVGSRVTQLDSLALALSRSGTLADVLASRTPLYLKNYGPGQLASISLRGTSARHTAVLWNGFNINLPSLGEADFALLPASGNTQVVVQHGPAGGTYGTAAMGGAVLLSSPVRWEAGARGTAQSERGSFGFRANSLEGSFSNARIAVRTALSQRSARNDFAYTVREAGGPVRRRQENAALRQWSLAQDLTLRTGQSAEWTAAAWLTDADRQIQPSTGSANNHAQERDQSRRLLAGYRRTTARHESAVRVAWFEDILNYRSDDVESRSGVRTTQAQAEHTLNFGPTTSLRVGAEAQHFAGQVDIYTVRENRFTGFALLSFSPAPTLRLTANLRQAVLPSRRAPLAPTLGAEWQLRQAATQQLTLKASASRSYRAPTLNERYWRTGNPNIAPESGFGYEAGLRHEWKPAAFALQTELTAYRQRIDDWVQWIPNSQGQYSPRNLRLVRTQGLELSTQLGWHHGRYAAQTRASYAFTQATKLRGHAADPDPAGRQLPYVPQHAAAFSTDHTWRQWLLSYQLSYTGPRFTDASATSFLPGYLLLNASAGRTVRVAAHYSLTLLAQGFNLTNRVYHSYEYRAMPLRSANVSLRVAWH
ncbi:iron complex outermembrane recepter protein [Hymenobacter daecheongensis DSM 21074]|uniref:Iron complex outermembrane recepter protein n=1 Tax=Hymenobacter daecheongensis DSM 21074 TaxID=1121955 RepID=A0A1M6DF82_9BACT|nr:TonB-dependent receptor [Hymenobacter daecheongensis]SHI71984.1 iron complex outermembrane recepter protein [Hymenobacter daecheongensis DSM 21074]